MRRMDATMWLGFGTMNIADFPFIGWGHLGKDTEACVDGSRSGTSATLNYDILREQSENKAAAITQL